MVVVRDQELCELLQRAKIGVFLPCVRTVQVDEADKPVALFGHFTVPVGVIEDPVAVAVQDGADSIGARARPVTWSCSCATA